jgi:hypothetical protein
MGSIEYDVFNSYSVVAYVFFAAVIFSPSRCLTNLRRIHVENNILMRGLYGEFLRCHDISIKCHKDLFMHLAFNKTDSAKQTVQCSHRSIFIFLIIKKVGQ